MIRTGAANWGSVARRFARSAAIAMAAVLAGGIIPTGAAYGWSEETHQTTGAIAWGDLRQRDPATLAQLLKLAEQHPDYPLFVRHAGNLTPAMRERALFEWLGRWPDDIRDGPRDHPEWHYELRVVHGRTGLWPFRNGSASEGFALNYALLANSCAAPTDRAMAIGWLIHIIGDVQQPLHAGHQMTSTFNMTDRAGTIAYVRRQPGAEPTELHQYWDRTMERSGVSLPSGYGDWASALQAIWPRARLPELAPVSGADAQFSLYLDESMELARLVAYRGTFLHASAEPAAAPAVTPQENQTALQLSQRRITTGGYRIADMLSRATAESRTTTCS